MKEDQRRRKRKAREQNPLMRRGYLEKHVVEYHMRLKVDREGMPRNLHGVPRVFFSPSALLQPLRDLSSFFAFLFEILSAAQQLCSLKVTSRIDNPV